MKFQWKLAAAISAVAFANPTGRADEPAVLAITNVTIIKPALNSSQAGVTVVLRDGRIAAIGKSTRVPAGSQVIEGRGKYLIPGLADAHVHPYPAPTTGDVKETKDLVASFLPWGITTAFSPAMPLQKFNELRPELLTENAKYPKFYSTVVAYRVDGPGPGNALSRPDSVEKAKESVRYFHSHHVNGIKLIYDDASYASSVPLRVMKREIMEALIDEAHRLGIKAYAHAPVLKLAKETLRAGADGLVHGIISDPVDHEFLELMKKNRAVYISTSSLFEGLKDFPAFLRRHLELYPNFPGAARVNEFLRNPIPLQAPGFNFDRPDAVARQLPVLRANLRKIYDSGVTVVTGSDSAGGLTSLIEIILHVESGLTPMQALRAATINAQKMVGRDKDAGTIQPGKVADLVLLDGNPLADIRNVAKLNRVFRAGVALSRADQSPVSSKAKAKFDPNPEGMGR
ncbi:MAG TPA: amidohydrolase family protein [Bryobacteraceae bacterium]|nr:amidohydrolase family protein [Bryobacteraceae bacterium]